VPIALMAKLWTAAALAAFVACVVEHYLPEHGPIVAAVFVLSTYGIAYFAATYLLRVAVGREVIAKLVRRLGVG